MHPDSINSKGAAFGQPGIPPTWSPGNKDGVGTAYSQASRVWFTLAMGILTEIYYPTIDRPQTRDAQFLITDGETFFHEEKRDLATHVERLEAEALGYRLTSSDPKGRYGLVKEIISDPHQPCVLVRTNFAVRKEWQGKLRIYVLLAPHLEVGGWGNSARKMEVAGSKVLVAWKNNIYLALGCDHGFSRSSCGFVGASDGWQDLHDNFKMDWEFDRAENGNVAVMGEIDLSQGNEFTLGIAFGDGLHAAVSVLSQALAMPFARNRRRFVDQWQRVRGKLHPLEYSAGDGGQLCQSSKTEVHIRIRRSRDPQDQEARLYFLEVPRSMNQVTENGEKTLADWRCEIDAVDTELLRLLSRRASIACEVALIKVAAGLAAYDERRERQVLERVDAQNQGPLGSESVLRIFRSIIRETRRLGTKAMRAQESTSKSKKLIVR